MKNIFAERRRPERVCVVGLLLATLKVRAKRTVIKRSSVRQGSSSTSLARGNPLRADEQRSRYSVRLYCRTNSVPWSRSSSSGRIQVDGAWRFVPYGSVVTGAARHSGACALRVDPASSVQSSVRGGAGGVDAPSGW